MTNEKTIHKKNLQCLAKETYMFLQKLSPTIMDDIFEVRVISINLQSLQNAQRSSDLEINL